jgi:hypothetical protein
VDIGPSQELVTVTAVSPTSITGIFSQNHPTGTVVTALGSFPNGILNTSTPTQLQMFGDIYGDGSLVFAEYTCDLTAKTLSRSVTPVSATNISAAQVLISNLATLPPPQTPCNFAYTQKLIAGVQYKTAVGITVSVQTNQRDPQTNAYILLTKSLLNVTARNIVAGLDNFSSSISTNPNYSPGDAAAINRLQPTPANLPLL